MQHRQTDRHSSISQYVIILTQIDRTHDIRQQYYQYIFCDSLHFALLSSTILVHSASLLPRTFESLAVTTSTPADCIGTALHLSHSLLPHPHQRTVSALRSYSISYEKSTW